MPPVVPPFLIGLVVAPLAKRLLRPLVGGVVKASVGIAMEVKKAAHEAGENIHDLAAEVAADVMAAQVAAGDTESRSVPGQHTTGNSGKGERRAPKIRATAENAAAKTH
ncbi:DUF5132 domain-containing protein [Streptomyces sp. NBC_00525]|uniref:DUF5132 domain-containing protein n=1 Tax=Streptomyces sp. NBC_00525 TaxID=2903660 RepID=UPI002E821D5D|nr:DUF5132 domain-containing protein [Streptomyces sp. NBC_00525]WUC97294.1 DUF5132 domain-containing protein [Streptomyces sp. NBC_00525]